MHPQSLPKNVLYYGREEALPERIALRAGPLSLFYEDGDLRYIKLGEQEILRRIYVAVRDRNWGTILPVFSQVQMDIRQDSFHISFEIQNTRDEIDFAWKGVITGDPAGTITFSMDGAARSTFWRNRIGFCVLHPAGIAGASAIAEHVDGGLEQTSLPVYISPEQPVLPFAELKAISHQVRPGVWAEVRFAGDIFEMEDQRNWTDASYKTFCTPLRLPFPVEVKAGTHIAQSITLSLKYEGEAQVAAPVVVTPGAAPGLAFTLQPDLPAQPLPKIGLGCASHAGSLSDIEIERLKKLNLAHLRLDLPLSDPGYPGRLEQAAREASLTGVPLEIALFVTEDGEAELAGLRRELERIRPGVYRWLVYPAKELYHGGSPTALVVGWAKQQLAGWDASAQFAAGTNTDLIFMLRTLPPITLIDRVTIALTPQVHAFDNASLVETLEAQAQAVETARQAAVGLPVMVSPVTFKMRFNPYATGPVPPTPAGELPSQVDVRQMSLFGAGWTAGSLRYLSLAGAASLTYFETTGWRGVMEISGGSLAPEKFRSMPGCVFPMYHVFADIGEYAGGQALAAHSSDRLAVDGLALRKGERRRILLANFTDQPCTVNVVGVAQTSRIRLLDETNVEWAMRSPDEYRSAGESLRAPDQGRLALDMLPYAVARVDW